MKYTPELAEALTRLRSNTDFVLFLNTLGDYGEQLVQQMIYAPNAEQLQIKQGETRAVTEILKLVHTAPEKHRKATQ